MKTLMLFNECDNGVCFLEFDGDLSKLNGTYLNSSKGTKNNHEALSGLLYDDNGEWIGPKRLKVPTKDWDIFVECGFLP